MPSTDRPRPRPRGRAAVATRCPREGPPAAVPTPRRLAVTAFAMGISTRQIEDLFRVALVDDGPDHATLGRWTANEAERGWPIPEALDAACNPRVQTLAVDEPLIAVWPSPGPDAPPPGVGRAAAPVARGDGLAVVATAPSSHGVGPIDGAGPGGGTGRRLFYRLAPGVQFH